MGGQLAADILFLISNISFAAAAVCLILAVILFFRFKIPSVIGDLSGRNVRKSIEQMRTENEKKARRNFRPGDEGGRYGKVTDEIGEDRGKSPDVSRNRKTSSHERPDTGLLNESKMKDPLAFADKTDLLGDEDETERLEDETVTEFLADNGSGQSERESSIRLEILEEIILIHTDEVISNYNS